MWQRVGTVTVQQGSKNVAGINTQFVSGDVKTGYVFVGPDYSLYEIDTISSNTGLTLKESYRGANAAGAAYSIFQTQSVIKDLADQVGLLINGLAGLKAAYEFGLLVTTVNGVAATNGELSLTTKNVSEDPSALYYKSSRVDDRVRTFVLAELSTATPAVVTAADTILSAIGKLQAQINAASDAARVPVCSAYQSAAQAIQTGVWTKVLFQTKEFDTNNCYDAPNNRFKPNVQGYYLVQVSIGIQISPATQVAVAFYLNGAFYKMGQNNPGSAYGASGSMIVFMDGASEYVEVYAYLGSGQSLTPTRAATNFSATLVRRL